MAIAVSTVIKEREAAVEIIQANGGLHLEITDNGGGFQEEKETKGPLSGFGLRGMEERARLCGGTFRIDSQPGRGTQVEVRIPLKEISPGRAGRT